MTTYNNGCVEKDSVYIAVIDYPELNLSASNDSICLGNELILSANTSSSAIIEFENNIINNQAFVPDSSNTYVVSSNLNECITVDSIRIIVNPYSEIIDITNDFSICEGENIILNAQSSKQENIWWSNQVVNGVPFQNNETTLYYFYAQLYNCISKDSVLVEIFPNVEANFNYDILDYKSNLFNIDFKNLSTYGNDIDYLWQFDNELETSTDFETSYDFEDHNEYVDVSLFVVNQYACMDSITKTIYLEKSLFISFYLPTAFTPNNDLKNDYYKPIFNTTPISYNFSIYNRWGNIIFENSDFEQGWDGTYKEKIVPSGIYISRLEYNKKVYINSFTVTSTVN